MCLVPWQQQSRMYCEAGLSCEIISTLRTHLLSEGVALSGT